jgi:phosphate transport system substrate-binding protein
MKKILAKYSCIVLITLMLFSCSSNKKNESKDTWNTGTVTIATDINLKEIAEQLTEIYEHEYVQAKIILNFQPQDKIISDFLNGKITSMIVNRNLSHNELELASQNQEVRIIENILAYNAVALIANKSFKDSVIDFGGIKNYLQPNSAIKLVFDNKQSGIAKLILEREKLDATLFKNALVVNNVNEVIEFINNNKTGIGFIPFNFISDPHSKETAEILSKVKILGIKEKDTISNISQQSIYDNHYPLQQTMTIVLGKNPEIVATAFVNWAVKERAAKILLKAGLVPRLMPDRNLNIQSELKTN